MSRAKDISRLFSEQIADDISTDGSAVHECAHDWHTASWFGPNPFPGLEGWEVCCNHCGQWAFQEAVEVGDCEWSPVGDPIIFDSDTLSLYPSDGEDGGELL